MLVAVLRLDWLSGAIMVARLRLHVSTPGVFKLGSFVFLWCFISNPDTLRAYSKWLESLGQLVLRHPSGISFVGKFVQALTYICR
jgi:hypothetical protein